MHSLILVLILIAFILTLKVSVEHEKAL